MEQRRHPRIQLPLLVELKHPSLGSRRCIARDISEGGVYVYTENPQVKPGAKAKVTLLNPMGVEAQPTPTVEMEVTRVEDGGLALSFTNVTGRHLWQSVERLRTELAIGRDYFQVHMNVMAINDADALLLAQQHGKWTFPATFLVVGQDWRQAVTTFMANELGVTVDSVGAIISMDSVDDPELPEAAVLNLFIEAHVQGKKHQLSEGSRYRTLRWVDRRRDVEEATFASEQMRALADAALMRRIKDDGESGP